MWGGSLMRLYVRGVPAETGMEVTMNNSEKGKLVDWRRPHKPSSTGRVYVSVENSTSVREYFPSVIGAEWRKDIDMVYEEIGKEFEDFNFDTTGTAVFGDWLVRVEESAEVDHLEIKIPDEETLFPENSENDPAKLSDINNFTYAKKSQVTTNYIFTRRKSSNGKK